MKTMKLLDRMREKPSSEYTISEIMIVLMAMALAAISCLGFIVVVFTAVILKSFGYVFLSLFLVALGLGCLAVILYVDKTNW